MRGIDIGVATCHVCHKMVKLQHEKKGVAHCPRCGETVHIRIPHSIQHTWALVIASLIFYVPANMFPMMHVHTIAGTQSDTILSGVRYFIHSGAYLIAAVIFIASIVVPILKLVLLIYLLVTVQKGSAVNPKRRRKLYIITEIIGKWSMVDVYVVTIMIALVHFGNFSEIEAGKGANYFLLVVILTMLAAMQFDPRLIWDTAGVSTKEKRGNV